MKHRSPATLHHFVRLSLAAAVAALTILVSGCQTDRQQVPASASNQIFDEQTRGSRLVSDALAVAGAENRSVILLFGANWCAYCRQLHAMLETGSTLGPIVRDAFLVVPIDVGTSARNRNVDLIDRYRSNVFSDGTPSLVVLSPSGRRIAPTGTNPWSARNRLEEARVASFLTAAADAAEAE